MTDDKTGTDHTKTHSGFQVQVKDPVGLSPTGFEKEILLSIEEANNPDTV